VKLQGILKDTGGGGEAPPSAAQISVKTKSFVRAQLQQL